MARFYVPSLFGALAFTVCFCAWAIFELIVNLRVWRRGSQNRDRCSRYLIIGGMLVAFALAVWAASAAHFADMNLARPFVFYLGLALMIAGLVFRWYAIRQLGGYFVPEVVIQPGQRVVEAGVYRHIRHPSYAGTLITVLGYGLALTNWFGLVIMLVIASAIYSIRMNVEEAALMEAFGDEYRAYMKRTKRVIPFVY